MKYCTILDLHGVELQRNPMDGNQHYNETLEYAYKITAESQTMEHPDDPRTVVIVDDEAEA